MNQTKMRSAFVKCYHVGQLSRTAAYRLFSSASTDNLSFTFAPARYNGINIDLRAGTKTPDAALFEKDLTRAIEKWRSEGRGSVWLRCDVSQGALIGAASSACGFEFHHAEGKEAVLHKWLKPGICPVPPYATHQVGVGAVVMDERKRLLVVREAGLYRSNQWKFPTGLADLGEDFGAAAQRETFEETGIQAKFASVIAFRHQHRTPDISFGRSDIFVLCRLIPSSFDIKHDVGEIAECKWMDAEEFLQHSDHPLSRFAVSVAADETVIQQQSFPHTQPHTLASNQLNEVATRVGKSLVEEEVYIPVLKREVRIYRPAAAPAISSFAKEQLA